jgi:hypothetical protein
MRTSSENQLTGLGGGDDPQGFVQNDGLTWREINKRMNTFLRGRGMASHQLKTLEERQTIMKKTKQLEARRAKRGDWRKKLLVKSKRVLRKLGKFA